MGVPGQPQPGLLLSVLKKETGDNGMRKCCTAILALAAAAYPTFAPAADMGRGGTHCTGAYRSSILELSSQQAIVAEVSRRYGEALSASEDPRVISSRSQIYVWANETKVSCAKAIGFLKDSEVNEYQISQCDCYYSRMFTSAR